MGTWGPKLYQDDIASDIKSIYIDRLKRGKTTEEITADLKNNYAEEIADPDDGPIFWMALAEIQWKYGRLLPEVRDRAIESINRGTDQARWEKENPKQAPVRRKVLEALRVQLLSPMPNPKKVSQYHLYHCPWMLGDVYAYQLTSDYAQQHGWVGRYLLFHKVGETLWWPGHTIPVVRVKLTLDDKLPQSEETFDRLEYIQYGRSEPSVPGERQIQRYCATANPDADGWAPEYQIGLLCTSKRVIPKSLFFLANYQNVTPPDIEIIDVGTGLNIPTVYWKDLEQKTIDRYNFFHSSNC